MKDHLLRLASPYLALPLYAQVMLAVLIPVLTTLVGLALVVRLPADTFVRPPGHDEGPRSRWKPVLVFMRNIFGIFLLLLGLVLAIPLIPGPGAVFLLLGLGLTDFPGKRRLELRLLRIRGVLSSINRLRARFGRPPLIDPRV